MRCPGNIAPVRGNAAGKRACLVVVVSAATILAASSAHAAPLTAAPNDGEWLFIEQAQHATLRPAPGPGALRLTLIAPSATVQAFTDRPARRFDVEPLSRFVAEWPAHFGHVPPNAAIDVSGANPAHDVLMVELLHAHLDSNGRLTYRVRALRNSKRASDLRYFQRRADRRLPVRLGRTSLFIDDADDSTIPLTVNFRSSGTWNGVFILSSVLLGSISTQGQPGNVRYAGNSSGFALQTFGDTEGGVTLAINPLGDCAPVIVENSQGAPESLSAVVNNNPAFPLINGTNEVPVGPTPCG